jgi:predicted alpha/beta superfamily hydrolase
MKTHNNYLATKILLICIIGVFVLKTTSLQAGDNNKIVIDEKVIIQSKVLNEERTMLVYLPSGYELSNSEYPVLYVLDGATHFLHATAAVDYLSKRGFSPEMIVVAIINVDRNRDFTPVKSDRRQTSGGAEKFHDFLNNELITYVEKNYPASKYRILMGHSLGGTFAAWSMLEHPDIFNDYIAVSPYLQYKDNYLIAQAKSKLKKEYDKPKSFYMTVGDEPNYLNVLDEFSGLIQEKSDSAIKFLYVQMQDENHGTTPYLSMYNGLRFIFSDYRFTHETFLEGIEALDRHYEIVSKKYGIKVVTAENTINHIGYNYLGEGEIEKAIKIFKEGVKRFPNSANVYDSLGEAYEKNDQIKLAKTNYKKAVEIGYKQNHISTPIFKKNLDRVSNQLHK